MPAPSTVHFCSIVPWLLQIHNSPCSDRQLRQSLLTHLTEGRQPHFSQGISEVVEGEGQKKILKNKNPERSLDTHSLFPSDMETPTQKQDQTASRFSSRAVAMKSAVKENTMLSSLPFFTPFEVLSLHSCHSLLHIISSS